MKTTLPYKDDDGKWDGQTVSASVSEVRALRDSYGRKAVVALTLRFSKLPAAWWEHTIERACRCPYGETEGLSFLASLIEDMTGWAAVTRFCWLAEKVWEMECGELAAANTTWGKESA